MGFLFKGLSESVGGGPILLTGDEETMHLVRVGCREIITLRAYSSVGADHTVTIEVKAPSSVPLTLAVPANGVSDELSFALEGTGALIAVTALASVSSGIKLIGHVVQDYGNKGRE